MLHVGARRGAVEFVSESSAPETSVINYASDYSAISIRARSGLQAGSACKIRKREKSRIQMPLLRDASLHSGVLFAQFSRGLNETLNVDPPFDRTIVAV